MADDLVPRADAGPRLAAREAVAAVDRDDPAGPLAFRGNLRDHAGRSLFASVAAFHRMGGLPRDVQPLMDFWERRGLPGRTRPLVHRLSGPVYAGVAGWAPSPEDVEAFREVWICPEEYAVDAMHHLRAVAAKDPFRRSYWQANISRVVRRDVDRDGSPIAISVIAYGVSSREETWRFDAGGVLRRDPPEPEVVAIADALLSDSHSPHRAAEPRLDDPSFRAFFPR